MVGPGSQPIRAQLPVTCRLTRVSPQVNLLPELTAAFSDAGGGVCQLLSRPQRPGEAAPPSPVQVSSDTSC